jgi:hypothetical protein
VAIKEMAIEEVGGGQGFGNLRPQWNLLKLVARNLMTGGQEERVVGWPRLGSNPKTGPEDGHTEQRQRKNNRVPNTGPRWSRLR